MWGDISYVEGHKLCEAGQVMWGGDISYVGGHKLCGGVGAINYVGGAFS